MLFLIFFFSSRRRHTSWPRDWSSDVCSSDLVPAGVYIPPLQGQQFTWAGTGQQQSLKINSHSQVLHFVCGIEKRRQLPFSDCVPFCLRLAQPLPRLTSVSGVFRHQCLVLWPFCAPVEKRA